MNWTIAQLRRAIRQSGKLIKYVRTPFGMLKIIKHPLLEKDIERMTTRLPESGK